MQAIPRSNDAAAARRTAPLAQVELLLLFHPQLQRGAARLSAETCARASQAWLTLDVHGRRGISELTGRPIMEDLQLEAGGQDIEALLPDGIVNDIADHLLEEA